MPLNQPSQASVREIRPSPHVVARAVGDTTVLVHLQNNRIFELNTTGTCIWELVASGASDLEIVERLSADFTVTAELAERDFKALLADLEREGLLGIVP